MGVEPHPQNQEPSQEKIAQVGDLEGQVLLAPGRGTPEPLVHDSDEEHPRDHGDLGAWVRAFRVVRHPDTLTAMRDSAEMLHD